MRVGLCLGVGLGVGGGTPILCSFVNACVVWVVCVGLCVWD